MCTDNVSVSQECVLLHFNTSPLKHKETEKQFRKAYDDWKDPWKSKCQLILAAGVNTFQVVLENIIYNNMLPVPVVEKQSLDLFARH